MAECHVIYNVGAVAKQRRLNESTKINLSERRLDIIVPKSSVYLGIRKIIAKAEAPASASLLRRRRLLASKYRRDYLLSTRASIIMAVAHRKGLLHAHGEEIQAVGMAVDSSLWQRSAASDDRRRRRHALSRPATVVYSRGCRPRPCRY